MPVGTYATGNLPPIEPDRAPWKRVFLQQPPGARPTHCSVNDICCLPLTFSRQLDSPAAPFRTRRTTASHMPAIGASCGWQALALPNICHRLPLTAKRIALLVYLPMQKLEKIRRRMSSAVVAPVSPSSADRASYRSSRTISWGTLSSAAALALSSADRAAVIACR